MHPLPSQQITRHSNSNGGEFIKTTKETVKTVATSTEQKLLLSLFTTVAAKVKHSTFLVKFNFFFLHIATLFL